LDPINASLIYPEGAVDFMSYCWGKLDLLPFLSGLAGYGYPAWTSLWTYDKLYQKSFDVTGVALPMIQATIQPGFLVAGIAFSDGSASLEPVWEAIGMDYTMPAGPDYCVEGRDSSGNRLISRCFSLAACRREHGLRQVSP
jgi:hypothetical protein